MTLQLFNAIRSVDVCEYCVDPMPCKCYRELGMNPRRIPRWTSKRYLAYIRELACSVPDCFAKNIEAAHFGPRGIGRKVHDCLAIPLCSKHHRDAHDNGRKWEYYVNVEHWQIMVMASWIIKES